MYIPLTYVTHRYICQSQKMCHSQVHIIIIIIVDIIILIIIIIINSYIAHIPT